MPAPWSLRRRSWIEPPDDSSPSSVSTLSCFWGGFLGEPEPLVVVGLGPAAAAARAFSTSWSFPSRAISLGWYSLFHVCDRCSGRHRHVVRVCQMYNCGTYLHEVADELVHQTVFPRQALLLELVRLDGKIQKATDSGRTVVIPFRSSCGSPRRTHFALR